MRLLWTHTDQQDLFQLLLAAVQLRVARVGAGGGAIMLSHNLLHDNHMTFT